MTDPAPAAPPSHLALVFPGAEYGIDAPALRYPARVLAQLGAEVRVVGYGRSGGAAGAGGGIEALVAGVRASVADVLAERGWDRVTLVAKSLGTLAIATAMQQVALPGRTSAIWLTPLFGRPAVREGAISSGWPSLLVAGSADPAHDAVAHELVVEGLGAASVEIPGADHALEVAGDVRASVQAMVTVVDAVLAFANLEC
ncbi:MAG: alpha/beta fold hydrolase [Acidimicrobiales bacterium]